MFDQTSSSITNNRWKFLSNSSEGFLSVDGVSIDSMAQKYGTPFYVFVESEIRDRIRTFKNAFDYPNVRIQYACKCNSNLEIMRIANEEGIDIDASSVGEIMLALMADFQPTQVTFTNLYKTEQDMVFASKIGVQAITIDSIEELERADRAASQIGGKMRIFLRFNPLIDYQDYTTRNQQYGIPMTSANDAVKKAVDSQNLDLVGFHFHGAYIKYKEIYFEAAKKLVELAVYTKENFGVEIKAIDLGGGMPYVGQPGSSFDIESFGKEFSLFFKKLIEDSGLNYPQLIFEPGKSIIMNAGMAVMKIISVKDLPEKKVAVLDGSCYSNLPDILVSNESYHIKPTTIYNPQDLEKVTEGGRSHSCFGMWSLQHSHGIKLQHIETRPDCYDKRKRRAENN
jgi:diaminopimelate decarboxylase